MKGIYNSPFRVYLIVAVLALIGIYAGSHLPISLYPNSSKPTIWASVSYGNLTDKDFIHNYSSRIESSLEAISTDSMEVEKVVSNYTRSSNVSYQVEFKWGADPKEALREVRNTLNGLAGSWPEEIRDSIGVSFWSNSSGFIAISFFSESRNLSELYKILEPAIVPQLAKVKDAEDPGLWNPSAKEVRLTLRPQVMATFGLFPRDIETAIERGLDGYKGGSVLVGTNRLQIQMPRNLNSLKDLEQLLIPTPSGKLIHLSQVAHIDMGPASDSNRVFKTNGSKSLILFANPKSGGNVKRMAEEILSIVKEAMPKLPKDIQYRVLVDPSEFIRASVKNVFHEVFLAAGLAVLVLFLFIGSLRNTITAAIEIPLSMILAFILMKMFDMNLNLISLGGLALAAGMNVDASVVVMENIFRHFETARGPLDFELRMKIIIRAVKEVMLPIIASTLSTLVVFAPLAFTKDLTNAILGDLAKAVVFSHGFSMFIALIVVPTIRLHLMRNNGETEVIPKSPLEGTLSKTEDIYSAGLRKFILSHKVKWGVMGSIVIGLALLLTLVVPNLKREIIGTPDTDWMILSVNTQGNSLIKQMESTSNEIEARLLDKFGQYIKYTFVQIRSANRTTIMARLKDKHEMNKVWRAMEEEFQNTPVLYYWVGPWNPAELPIPNPPQLRLVVRGGNVDDRSLMAQDLLDKLRDRDNWPRTWTEPGVERTEHIVIEPHLDRWPLMQKAGARFLPFDLTDLSRTATDGKGLGSINIKDESYSMNMGFPLGTINTKEDLEAFPISIGEKIVPLKSIANVKLEVAGAQYYREHGRDLIVVMGKQKKGDESKVDEALDKTKKFVAEYSNSDHSELGMTSAPRVYFEDALFELNGALKQLGWALAISVLLILFTLLLQFGNLIHTMIIMVAIPLGVFGGTLSLYIFGSTLSLNSALGIILLNGIAVNNSIILVDFIRKLVDEGMTPLEAAILAARKRLRPILITSLTTILGMLPIAFGTGEGGKILQPLGISVAGGLWFSMLFTLFIVPLLEVMYLNRIDKKDFPRPQRSLSEFDVDEMEETPAPSTTESEVVLQ